jgi:hypothetical protein
MVADDLCSKAAKKYSPAIILLLRIAEPHTGVDIPWELSPSLA